MMKENPRLELMKVFVALKEYRLDGIYEVASHSEVEVFVELMHLLEQHIEFMLCGENEFDWDIRLYDDAHGNSGVVVKNNNL